MTTVVEWSNLGQPALRCRVLFGLGLGWAGLLAAGAAVASHVSKHSLAEIIRTADAIVVGRTTAVGAGQLDLSSEVVLLGNRSEWEHDVSVSYVVSTELPHVHGSAVLVFLKKEEAGTYALNFGSQGIRAVQNGEAPLVRATQNLLAIFSKAEQAAQRDDPFEKDELLQEVETGIVAILSSSFNEEVVAGLSVVERLTDFSVSPSSWPKMETVVLGLLNPDSALEVRVGAINALAANANNRDRVRLAKAILELCKSADPRERSVAGAALKRITDRDFGFKHDAPQADREEAILEWTDWLSRVELRN